MRCDTEACRDLLSAYNAKVWSSHAKVQVGVPRLCFCDSFQAYVLMVTDKSN